MLMLLLMLPLMLLKGALVLLDVRVALLQQGFRVRRAELFPVARQDVAENFALLLLLLAG